MKNKSDEHYEFPLSSLILNPATLVSGKKTIKIELLDRYYDCSIFVGCSLCTYVCQEPAEP